MTDGGLSPETRAWLAGAGNRLNEPVREDQPEDVQARLDAFAAIEVDLRSAESSDDARRFLAAGWRPPTAIAALVAAARAETAERIARKIGDVQTSAVGTGPDRNDFERGWLHAAQCAAVIARETR